VVLKLAQAVELQVGRRVLAHPFPLIMPLSGGALGG
jgi:hypothetical protein